MASYYIQRAIHNPHPMRARLETVRAGMEKAPAMDYAKRLAGDEAEFFTDGPEIMGYRGAEATYLIIRNDTDVRAIY